MKRDDLLYLQNIFDAVLRIDSYVQGLDRESFAQNLLVQDGVIRQIMIMGEAAKLLSNELRDRYAQVPWRQMARMRDLLIHRYFGVDLDEVWSTSQNDIPPLKLKIAVIIKELKDD